MTTMTGFSIAWRRYSKRRDPQRIKVKNRKHAAIQRVKDALL
jgi:hypothetical protein